ncbi:MAG TPA: hypothetical protein VMI31_06415, partial [Fimbriimonadaceae bacterium]|nr:hypothetical protein [Fimbriimonadaceae bacterium]
TFAFLTPIPLIVGLVAEGAYMLFVPDSKWYGKRLQDRYDAAIADRRKKLKEQILPRLSPAMRDRYLRLESTRDQIYNNADQNDSRTWFGDVIKKLDFLLEKFLLFGDKEVQFRNYLSSVLDEVRAEDSSINTLNVPLPSTKTNRAKPLSGDIPDEIFMTPESNWVKNTVDEIKQRYQDDLDKIQKFLDTSKEIELQTQAVLNKRHDVIQRRMEYIDRIGSILSNLNHQSRLMEDTFGMINDEIRARSPEQVLADIEDVVFQTNAMTSALEEVAPFEQMVARLSA